MRTLILALFTLTLLTIAPAVSQDKKDARAWAEALAYYQRCSASRDPLERRQCADLLGEATSEKHDKMCWQLVSALLRQELAKEGPNGRKIVVRRVLPSEIRKKKISADERFVIPSN